MRFLIYCTLEKARGALPYNYVHVPRERPPFSALNFRSRAYRFHKWQTNPLRSITILQFCRSGDHHFQNFFTFKPFRRHPRPFRAAPRGYSRPECQPDASYTKSVPKTRIFTLDSLQSLEPPFSLCCGTYLPTFWVRIDQRKIWLW